MGLPFFSRSRASDAGRSNPSGERGEGAQRAEQPDLYAVLGVPPHATHDEIIASYRRKAATLIDRWWLPGRADRQLAALNSAYEILGYPSRRTEYDAQRNWGLRLVEESDDLDDTIFTEIRGPSRAGPLRGGRAVRPRGTGFLDAMVIVFVVALALGTASVIISSFSPDLSGILDVAEAWGVTPRRRPATPSASVVPRPTESALTGQPTVMPSPTGAPPTGVERYAGTQVDVSDSNPPRRTDVTVTLRLVRDSRPVEGALVYLTARYRTTEERWPQGTATVRTGQDGQARITFNIGDATVGFPVPVDVVSLVDGQQFVWRSQFIPR